MLVYQYISAKYGLEAIETRKLKISRIDELNDPFEFFVAAQNNPDIRWVMQDLRKDFAPKTGILCFSKDWHNPVMWSHYAKNHTGLCLGFDINDELAKTVKYEAKRKNFDHILSNTTKETELLDMVTRMVLTKSSHWRYEKEVRCWAHLDPKKPRLQFEHFGEHMKLRHVCIGLNSSITRNMIQRALGQELANTVKITTTRLAYKTYRVVTQQNRKHWK